MKTIIEYLDDLKEKYGSDNKAAQAINIARETISVVRKRGQMGDELAIKIADGLGIDRSEVLIAAAIARSEGEVKKSWENISKLTGIAACIAIACVLNVNPEDGIGYYAALSLDNVYIMRSPGARV